MLTFRAVAHHRSFSGAARLLALSQPSVSNQVAALEREPGGLWLTHEGEILLTHADAIAERFQLADAQIAAAAHGRRVRLGRSARAPPDAKPVSAEHRPSGPDS